MSSEEARIPHAKLCRMARDVTPVVTGWADRTYAYFHATPPLPGMWRGVPVHAENIGWPVALHGSIRIGGHRTMKGGIPSIARFLEDLRACGFALDLDYRTAQTVTHRILGVAVFGELPSAGEDAPYRDPELTRWWTPFAQLWAFQEPMVYGEPRQTFHRMKKADRLVLVEHLRAARRLI